ncbi:MAG: hypothetical protein ACLVJZ_03605, partial [[Clostridium] leptum]
MDILTRKESACFYPAHCYVGKLSPSSGRITQSLAAGGKAKKLSIYKDAQLFKLERMTRLELATSTLARWR